MTPPRLEPLTPEDRERLKRVLLTTDDETQRSLGPLLALEPVQHLLLSFVKDTSRSFEDHVWDPMTQEVLRRLRDVGIDPNDQPAETRALFETALAQQVLQTQASMDLDCGEDELLTEADTARDDGRTKFRRGDYYPAMNAFKKSITLLSKYHEDQCYGEVIDPAEWEEDNLRQRYILLCCNVAVCGIKLNDCAMIRLFANKALRVDKDSSKAIYAMAKVNLLEQRFGDARAEVKKGRDLYPDNVEFVKLLKAIDGAESKQLRDQADLTVAKEQYEKMEEEARKQREQKEAEERARLERAAEVTRLPTLEEDELVFQRLNTYFMRIKQAMKLTIDPLHNPDNGEPPLFECNIINGSTGVVLATGVTASSKKGAKHAAARIALRKLWELKREAGKLLPEDQEHWEEFEKAQSQGKALPRVSSVKRADDENAIVSTHNGANDGVAEVTIYERQIGPAPLLHQLGMQRRLQVEFNFDDISPSKSETLFKCTCVINGEVLGTANAPGKKKAKAEAGRLALDAAVAKGTIRYVRTAPVVENVGDGSKNSTGITAAEVA